MEVDAMQTPGSGKGSGVPPATGLAAVTPAGRSPRAESLGGALGARRSSLTPGCRGHDRRGGAATHLLIAPREGRGRGGQARPPTPEPFVAADAVTGHRGARARRRPHGGSPARPSRRVTSAPRGLRAESSLRPETRLSRSSPRRNPGSPPLCRPRGPTPGPGLLSAPLRGAGSVLAAGLPGKCRRGADRSPRSREVSRSCLHSRRAPIPDA